MYLSVLNRCDGSLAHTIMHGAVDGMRGRGRPKATWLDDIVQWTGRGVVECMRVAEDRERWRRVVLAAKCPDGPHWPWD